MPGVSKHVMRLRFEVVIMELGGGIQLPTLCFRARFGIVRIPATFRPKPLNPKPLNPKP